MKNLLHGVVGLFLCLALSGCELLCQAGTGSCGMSKEQLHKLLHPKAYGEYFTKPGMTKEGWREDWVGCGGRRNGQYSGDAPSGSTSEVLSASWENASKKLDACMRSKGYEYRNEP